jgi:hypothetical protein
MRSYSGPRLLEAGKHFYDKPMKPGLGYRRIQYADQLNLLQIHERAKLPNNSHSLNLDLGSRGQAKNSLELAHLEIDDPHLFLNRDHFRTNEPQPLFSVLSFLFRSERSSVRFQPRQKLISQLEKLLRSLVTLSYEEDQLLEGGSLLCVFQRLSYLVTQILHVAEIQLDESSF